MENAYKNVDKKIENDEFTQNSKKKTLSFLMDFVVFDHISNFFDQIHPILDRFWMVQLNPDQFNWFHCDDADYDYKFRSKNPIESPFQSNLSQNLNLSWFNRLSLSITVVS